MIPRSGNHLEDALDDELNEKNKLDCGCVDRCKCDDDDDE